MTTAIVTLASRARLEHRRRQGEWIRAVAPDCIRVVVHLDDTLDRVLDHAGDGSLHVPPGPDGMRLAAGRNRGAREAIARGADLLCFLDVDCLPHPALIPTYETAASAMSGEIALLCGPVTYLQDGATPEGPAEADRFLSPHAARPAPAPGVVRAGTDAEWDLFWSLSFACTPASWAAIGGFDERYEGYGGEDTDFAWRARSAGAALHWVGGAHALHQYHPTTKPPWQHLDDILRNGRLFASTWGRWPMLGWIEAFAEAGAVENVDGDWRRVS
jgi:hypothetical protein